MISVQRCFHCCRSSSHKTLCQKRSLEGEVSDLQRQLSQRDAAREAVLADNTIDKHHISDAIKEMKEEMDQQLTRLRVESGDIELKRRHHVVSEQLQESKVAPHSSTSCELTTRPQVKNELLIKEVAELRTSNRLAGLERDSFKSEAEHSHRELARAREEREDLVETIARLQNELRRQQEKFDDALLDKVPDHRCTA